MDQGIGATLTLTDVGFTRTIDRATGPRIGATIGASALEPRLVAYD